VPNQFICVAITLGLIVALAACSAQAMPAYQEVLPPSLRPGDSIPGPTEKVVLTLYGDLVVKNGGDTLQFDMPTLEKLGIVEYAVHDPWLKSEVTYTGVLMSELSKFVGATDSATKVHIVALDDYQIDIPFTEIKKWPILLATRVNGEYMSIENSGPTRIIFPYHAYPEIDPVKYDDLWIWNIKSMEVN
jgi:hypothetical protein